MVLACVDSSSQVTPLFLSRHFSRSQCSSPSLCARPDLRPQTALVAGVARMSAAGVPHKNVFGEVFRWCTVMRCRRAADCMCDALSGRKVALSRGATVQLTSFDNHVSPRCSLRLRR